MGNKQVNCEARVNVDETEETKEESGPQMEGTKLTEEDSKKIKKRKQGNARQRKYRESKKNDPATKAKKKEENSKGSEKKATKEIADKIRKAFEENVNEETVGNGVAFIVEGVVQISPQSVVNLKVSLSGSPWSNLKQPGRYYMAEPPKKTDDKGYKLGRLEEALKIVFRGKKRKDGTRVLDGWHVNPLGFIQHLQTCTQKQGYHVDDKDARNNMIQWMQSKKSNATEKLEYFHYSGYSVFVGLEIKNYLAIANCSDDGETISDEELIEFPFGSILVISSHKIHHGWVFTGLNDIHHDNIRNTHYAIKGFIAIRESLGMANDLQEWFPKVPKSIKK